MRRTVAAFFTAVSLLCLSAGAALAAPPDNDDIANATLVASLPFSDMVDTTEATEAADDPDCSGAGPTVWYTYTPTEDQRLLADTFGSDYDTTLSAYVGSPGSLEQIACNDDAGGDVQSAIVIEVEAGTTYYFLVGAFDSGPGGTLVFNVDETNLQLPEIDVTVDPIGSFDPSTGTATITGTVTCSEGAEFAFVDVSLSQRVGRFIIRGFGGTEVTCDGTSQAWSVEVFGETGLFKGGRAEAGVFAQACNVVLCSFDFEEATVRLRGGR